MRMLNDVDMAKLPKVVVRSRETHWVFIMQ